MSDITINYKGNAIATMYASGTKTLLTEGKYLEDDVEVVYVKPGGGGVKTGTVTPASRTLTISFDSELSTIQGILVVPDSETPLKSGGKTCIGIIYTPNCFYTSIGLTSNNAGASLLAPAVPSGTISQNGTTVTIANGMSTPGYFETITYRWYAW